MHGLMSSGYDWIMNLPNETLAFMAADAGINSVQNTTIHPWQNTSKKSKAFEMEIKMRS